MGLALCSKHGESAVIGGISLDICEAISQRRQIEPAAIVKICIAIYDGDDFLYEETSYVSQELFETRKLKKQYIIRTEEQEQLVERSIPMTSGMCIKCFEDYLVDFQISIDK